MLLLGVWERVVVYDLRRAPVANPLLFFGVRGLRQGALFSERVPNSVRVYRAAPKAPRKFSLTLYTSASRRH